jgi:ubiquinone/menaquinone biosynthesis C-methylase UbiE
MASLKGVLNPKQNFVKGNAETWGQSKSFDIVTCMFATHEMPKAARLRVLENAKRIARKRVIFVDLDPDYIPSEAMLVGEPYVLEYKRNVDVDFKFRGAKK